MNEYKNVLDVVSDLDNWDDNHWVYVNRQKWGNHPETTKLYIITEDEIMDLEDAGQTVENSTGELIPETLENEDVGTLIELQTLDGVVLNLKKNNPDFDLALLITAINHYLEYDDFFE